MVSREKDEEGMKDGNKKQQSDRETREAAREPREHQSQELDKAKARPLSALEINQASKFLVDIKALVQALSVKVVSDERKLAIESLQEAAKWLTDELATLGTTTPPTA